MTTVETGWEQRLMNPPSRRGTLPGPRMIRN